VALNGKLQKARPVVGTTARVATVPPQSLVDQYVNRSFGPHTEFDVFEAAMEHGLNVLIEGPTGPGKTMAAMTFAALKGKHFYAVPSNVGVDPSQLFGKYIPDESGTSIGRWQDGPVTDIVRNGGVLLINEINFLPPRVATVIFGLLDGRREVTLLDHKGEIIRAHRMGCWCNLTEEECKSRRILVMADMNPDYLGTTQLNAALRNRFEIQLEWDYDPKVERKLVSSSTLLGVAANMRKMHKEGRLSAPLSTNMLMEFEKLASLLGLDFAMQNLVTHFENEDREAVRTALQAVKSNLESDYRKAAPAEEPKAASKTKSKGWDFVDDDPSIKSWLGED
jgi:MoxR-like ATPase